MKEINAIIRPEKLSTVCEALAAIDHSGMTIREVGGQGKEKLTEQVWKGEVYGTSFHAKVLIQIVAAEPDVQRVVHTILKAAWTGHVGDGKIIVRPIDQVYRIRWGERGEGVF